MLLQSPGVPSEQRKAVGTGGSKRTCFAGYWPHWRCTALGRGTCVQVLCSLMRCSWYVLSTQVK